MPAAHRPDWAEALEADAPDVVACWRIFTWDLAGLKALRREIRPRVEAGAAPRILAQQEAIGNALEAVLRSLPDRLLRAPGGEEDWNVAQAFAHTTAARHAATGANPTAIQNRANTNAAIVPARSPQIARPDAAR